MIAGPARRLAGFRFETRSLQKDESLPRMDVAVFVGFAASGPLHKPVATESPEEFKEIFGADVKLAWNAERGEDHYGYLGPAVRAFFRNGGKRCWVVRVAGAAEYNVFTVPGMALANCNGSITPAFLRARSEGSWSDNLRIAAAVQVTPLPIKSIDLNRNSIQILADKNNNLAIGDLVRLNFEQHGYVLYVAVDSIQSSLSSSPLQPARNLWLRKAGGKSPTNGIGKLFAFNTQGALNPLTVRVPIVANAANPIEHSLDWPASDGDQTVCVEVLTSTENSPSPGALVRIDFESDERFWLVISDVVFVEGQATPAEKFVRLSGNGYWESKVPSEELSAPTVDRLTFELWVTQDNQYPMRLNGLGFVAGHPQFWNELPTDYELYSRSSQSSSTTSSVAKSRFALAGGESTTKSFNFAFPMAMEFLPKTFIGPERVTKSFLERDGLHQFDARVFVGSKDATAAKSLVEASSQRVMEVADFLLYQTAEYQPEDPPALEGIYAALAIEEATLIAIPDIVHNGWRLSAPSSPPLSPVIPVDLPGRAKETFTSCETVEIQSPVITTDALRASSGLFHHADQGTFSLYWTPIANSVFELEESQHFDFSGEPTFKSLKSDHYTIYGRKPGDYYFRVRAVIGDKVTQWSHGIVVRVPTAVEWRIIPESSYDPNTFRVVQRALLRMCAGRGDLLAILVLPSHYREDDAIIHIRELMSTTIPFGSDSVQCPQFNNGESAVGSFGAIYHPWLYIRAGEAPNELRLLPPDGSVCGVMAKRALTRGAWIAPANEPIASVVALEPNIAAGRWLDLLAAQVNLVRDEPRGFLMLSADTLSDDEGYRPINVRRLLILLRRLAIRLGAEYAFEPMDDNFHRAVQRAFESMMEFLFAQGAFAGRTPESSFKVIAGPTLNNSLDQEQGRFFVELRVAPSLPLTFLTIRLVQSAARGNITEGT